MSAQAHATENTIPSSLTTISANARVDYILRFSKHAVLVVDQDESVYSQVASQFLGSLGNEHNAAFLAISPKLNDIQIRCRIIEQLFSGTLFDPEQSLAVSVINLAKQEKQAIDVVIEHAQFLSVQILHELCQLTDIAKKANYAISILMLGTPQAGMKLANNKSLFNNKVSVLSGQTGQLLALNAKVFKANKSFFKLTRFNKWMMAFISFIICLGLTGYWLFQQDVFSLKTKLSLESVTPKSTNLISAYSKKNENFSAEGEDIFLSLTKQEPQTQKTSKIILNVPAAPIDIVKAIISLEKASAKLPVTEKILAPKRFEPSLDNKPVIEKEIASTLDSAEQQLDVTQEKTIESIGTDISYYKSVGTGFVIQIAGFTDSSVNQDRLPDFAGINTKSYYRLFNDHKMLMITSEVYKTRFAAKQAITLLPSAIKSHQPWVKSIEAINNEINAYQGSQ